jgi:hypothetical protein
MAKHLKNHRHQSRPLLFPIPHLWPSSASVPCHSPGPGLGSILPHPKILSLCYKMSDVCALTDRVWWQVPGECTRGKEGRNKYLGKLAPLPHSISPPSLLVQGQWSGCLGSSLHLPCIHFCPWAFPPESQFYHLQNESRTTKF